MTSEPLKGKQDYDRFYKNDIKSAVEGLIKFHEDRIERLIKDLKESGKYVSVEIKIRISKKYSSISKRQFFLELLILERY